MTKTPEELTEDWKAGKLESGWYYTSISNVGVVPNLWFDDEWDDFMGMVEEVIAPCGYDEYKAMQSLVQNGESAIDTNKRLCKTIEELKEQLAEHRENCCCLENEKLRLDKAKLEEKIKEKEELIQCLGSDIDYLDVKKSVLIIENNKLRRLLEECVPYVTFKVNIEKNIGCTPPGAYLLTRIKDALGESEEKW